MSGTNGRVRRRAHVQSSQHFGRTPSFTAVASAILARDEVQIGIVENGGDPTQEGCFFEVDNVDAAYAEIHGAAASAALISRQQINGRQFRAFFVVAPDGLCYLVAQPVG